MISKNSGEIAKVSNINDVEIKYGHIIQILTDWINTTILASINGRDMAKSTAIQARRSVRCVEGMPDGAFVFVTNTYNNLEDNIMPAVQKSWQPIGLTEGVHYVRDTRLPESWRRRCSVIIDDYRHVYSLWNGCAIFVGSLDSPSLPAGKSIVHLFYNEAKYDKEVKVNCTMPILRGDAVTYGHSHLFLGITITTDMLGIGKDGYNWFFRHVRQVDPERIIKIVQAASVRNDLIISLLREQRKNRPSPLKLKCLKRNTEYYDRALLKLRKGQTFLLNAFSFANVEMLTIEYSERLYNGALGLHEFKKSVADIRSGLRRDLHFYMLLDEGHKYCNSTMSGETAYNSREFRYLHHDKAAEGDMDFGNMLPLVIGRPDGACYRVHKSFFEIPPGWLRKIADQFLTFFQNHKCKKLNLFYDRAGSNPEKQKEGYAGKIKDTIERDGNGNRTGWIVNLKSRKQVVIRQDAEYDFMQELMGSTNKDLPILLVNALNYKEMISSVEKAKAEIKYRGNSKVVLKVRKSEKLAPKKLPMLFANFSDAFEYLLMCPG